MLVTHLTARHLPAGWAADLSPIRHLAERGLTLTCPVTFLVGENGSGKSTVIEAIADVCGINSAGGKAGTKYSSAGSMTSLGKVLDAFLLVAMVQEV